MEDAVSLSRTVILDFLQKLNITDRVRLPREKAKIDNTVRATVDHWQLPCSAAKLEPAIVCGIDYARYSHPYAPLDFQVLLALYTVCMVCCDDALVTPLERKTFVEKLYAGQSQWHPVLSRLFEVTTKLREHYSAFGGNIICSGTAEYLNAMNLASIDGVHGPGVQSGAGRFVDYFRWKDGACEPYALFIWPQTLFPDVQKIVRAFPYVLVLKTQLSIHTHQTLLNRDSIPIPALVK
ncbi:hypothetical protein K474DRAFT_1657391 [Panus rudis PR-1116 ss-1]|nr:hypothetical protein K474DRAFT_1657391 [Panus rudis PR-1116 ss-1]